MDQVSLQTTVPAQVPYLLGKDNTIKQFMPCPCQNVRARQQNILTHLSGRKGHSWSMLFQDISLKQWDVQTSGFLHTENLNKHRDAENTNLGEIKAILNFLHFACVLKLSHDYIDNLYARGRTGVLFFPATMPLRRLRFSLTALHFDVKMIEMKENSLTVWQYHDIFGKNR